MKEFDKEVHDAIEEVEASSRNDICIFHGMSYEEAFRLIKELLYDDKQSLDSRYRDAIYVASMTLRRHQKKNVVLESDGYADGFAVYDALCPSCGEILEEDYDMDSNYNPYCPYCGQKLNWKLEEKKNENN